MTIDDLRELARLADGVVGQSPDRLAEVHRRIGRARRRRAASAVAASVVVAVALVAGSFALGNFTGRTPDPADSHGPQPSPTQSDERPTGRFQPRDGARRLTPRQTVLSYNAVLFQGVAAFDDPDVRVSLWQTTCLACPPCSECRTHPSFRALAVTDDGYHTTTYLRPQQINVQSITRTSGHAFLLNDESNARQRLLTVDGRLRPVRMVGEQRSTKDPGLVYQCDRNLTDPVIGHDKGEAGWCVLDVRSATAAPLPATWVVGRSMGRPSLGQRPWGIEYVYSATSGPLEGYDRAWWAGSGGRTYADLPQTPQLGPVASLSDDDTPTYFHWPQWSDRVDIFTVPDRASGNLRKVGSRPWLPLTRREMGEQGHPNEPGFFPRFARTPDGGLLAWSYRELTGRPGLTVWRADSLTRGAFEPVHQDGRQVVDSSGLGLDLTVHDGRIYLDTLVSDDDGRTWTEPVTTWRP
ncbi:MAG: hypothetical protein ABI807_05605 [Sporichthyaceae bacterium]